MSATPAESVPAPTADEPKPVDAPALAEPATSPKDGEQAPAATPTPAPAPAPAPAAEEPKSTEAPAPSDPAAPSKDEAAPSTPETPLSKLFAQLDSITTEAGQREIWGVELSNEEHVPSAIVLEKFLRANGKDVTKAKAQLIEALKWRKSVNPGQLLAETEFDSTKFGGLGYVTTYPKSDTHGKEIVTWNIYGGVKDNKATFGNVEEFIKWRSALMELSVKELDLASATEKIPANGEDPYRMVQVHDYLNVSFFRMDPAVRAASKEAIQTFSMAYPELLKEKFFVNVPVVMSWVFAGMKLFLSPETIKKFHPLSYGGNLAGELKSFGQELPVAYGGKGGEVKDGLAVKYTTVEVKEDEVKKDDAKEDDANKEEAQKGGANKEEAKKEEAKEEAAKKEETKMDEVKKDEATKEESEIAEAK